VLKPVGTACNTNVNLVDDCDLPDMCTGVDATCPNAHKSDGTSCFYLEQCLTDGHCLGGFCRGTPVQDGTGCRAYPGCTIDDMCVNGTCVRGSTTMCATVSQACYTGSRCICCPPGYTCRADGGTLNESCLPNPNSPTCDTLPNLDAAHCLLSSSVSAPLCVCNVPARFDDSLRATFQSALSRLERAMSMTGGRRAHALKRVRSKLERARRRTDRATTRAPAHRLDSECAATIELLIRDVEQRIANP